MTNFSSLQPVPKAKKSLGQNFLRDPNICRKIVSLLDIDINDHIVEIGPGPGALTQLLIQQHLSGLTLIEKDDHFASQWQQYAQSVSFPMKVCNIDALHIKWEEWDSPWKCIGNLPYNIASPLMWELFSRSTNLVQAVFMVQKEVGERLIAKPGTKAYGALSVWVQTFVEPKLSFIVPPHVFVPRPKIDSAVLVFHSRKERPHVSLVALAKVLRHCFQLRRKQLGTIFKSFPNALERLDKLNINNMLRPESLSPNDFYALAETFF